MHTVTTVYAFASITGGYSFRIGIDPLNGLFILTGKGGSVVDHRMFVSDADIQEGPLGSTVKFDFESFNNQDPAQPVRVEMELVPTKKAAAYSVGKAKWKTTTPGGKVLMDSHLELNNIDGWITSPFGVRIDVR